MDEEDTENAGIHNAANEIPPEDSRNQAWEQETHGKCNDFIVPVLPNHNGVLVEVGDIGTADTLGVLCVRSVLDKLATLRLVNIRFMTSHPRWE